MAVRGVRGATTADENSRKAILEATAELLQAVVAANDLDLEEIASVIFSTTADLTATFPALAARQIGWGQVPLMGFREIEVPGSLARCVRVLLHLNTEKRQGEVRHVYLKGAVGLRDAVTRDLS